MGTNLGVFNAKRFNLDNSGMSGASKKGKKAVKKGVKKGPIKPTVTPSSKQQTTDTVNTLTESTRNLNPTANIFSN